MECKLTGLTVRWFKWRVKWLRSSAMCQPPCTRNHWNIKPWQTTKTTPANSMGQYPQSCQVYIRAVHTKQHRLELPYNPLRLINPHSRHSQYKIYVINKTIYTSRYPAKRNTASPQPSKRFACRRNCTRPSSVYIFYIILTQFYICTSWFTGVARVYRGLSSWTLLKLSVAFLL
jgi:hypothetical protein